MLVRAHSLGAQELLQALMSTIVSVAERHLDWRVPGYTHLQRAQPGSHHLLAYFWKFRRDLQRFNFCMTARDDLPLGAGALAGVNFDTSRMFVAQELGVWRHRRELARRGVEPGLRHRLPVRGRDLRDSPVPARRGDRALVEPGVRLLRGGRLVRPARASCRRRRTPTPPSSSAPRRRAWPAPDDAPRRPPRPAADLQQGPPGGQGAALRRGRHARAVPASGGRDAPGHRVRPRADGGGGLG